MSMLSSVFGKRKNFQRRLNNLAHRIPTGRAPSPPSPGSFASPDVFDPYRPYANASQASLAQPPPQISRQNGGASSTSSGNGAGSSKRISSPQVQLDFAHDTTLTDWFPSELLNIPAESEPRMRPERNVSLVAKASNSGSLLAGTAASSSGSALGNRTSTAISPAAGPGGAGHAVRIDATARDNGDEDGGYDFGEDEVIDIGAPGPRGRDPVPSPLGSKLGRSLSSPRPREDDEADALSAFQDTGASQAHRRHAPSPIRIPRRTSGEHLHLQRSASLSSVYSRHTEQSPSRQAHSDPETLAPSRAPSRARVRTRLIMQRSRSISRPGSEYSRYSDTDIDYDEGINSAISGTTLARQLASTYTLSSASSQRRSRGHLARQDSATLPRSEYGFLPSRRSVRSSRSSASVRGSVTGNGQPYWKGENGVPPVPPMPEGISPGFPLSPASRCSSGDPNTLSPIAKSRRTSPAGLDVLLAAPPTHEHRISNASRQSSYHSSLGGSNSLNAKRLTLDPDAKRRRISRISEGSGSAGASTGALSSAQNNMSQTSLPFAGDQERAEVPKTIDEGEQMHIQISSDPDESYAQELIVPHLSNHSTSPDAPTTATSSSISPYSRSTPSNSPHTVITPGTSSSGSVYSPGPSMTAVLSPGGTSFSISPNFSSGRSLLSASSVVIGARSPLGTASDSDGSSFSSRKPVVALLPIGERPRSAQVPRSPSSSRASEDSIGRPHSTTFSSLSLSHSSGARTSQSPTDSLDSPDLLDSMLFPAPRAPVTSQHTGSSTGGNARVGSPPAPISVPPISEGFSTDPDAQPPSTASAIRQTFPETPYAFTPLTGKSFGSPPLPSGMQEVPPALPRTATVGRAGLVSRGRGDGITEMSMRTLSSPPGNLTTAILIPPLTGWVQNTNQGFPTDDVSTGKVTASGMLLSAIEESSAPGTPSTRPSSYATTSDGSPIQKRPRSLKSEHASGDEQRRSPPVDRPPSLVPAKRPLTPLPSPPQSAVPLSPSPSPSEQPSLPVLSPELKASSNYLPLPDSRNGTPSPVVSSGRFSRRPSGASDTYIAFLAQSFLSTPDITPSKRAAHSRPPPPSGPRKPSIGPGNLYLRSRNGSVSSQTSMFTGSAGTRTRYPSMSLSASSPRFQSTPVKFRALTMEAAQWTLTSNQLQEVVSTAIKKSADASRIRLLPIDTMTTQIPAEINRLEALSAEVRTNYKLAVRRRRTLLGSLCNIVESGDLAASARVIEEVSDLTETLDNHSEELYNVTDQITQLKHLSDVHSSSALAMALRKLNSSFLKHLKEKQDLRNQVLNLEQERDDAWKQAQDAAEEIDALNVKLAVLEGAGVPTPASSRRSSRVLVARKASMRVSKAGLRSPSRLRSQRSSYATQSSEALSPGIRSAGIEDVPPVPPMPIPTSMSVFTPGLRSIGSSTTSQGTPSSETRAMVLAQQELCVMLGISAEELHAPSEFRPRSMSAALESPEFVPQPHSARLLARRNSELTPRSRASDSFPFRRRSRSIDGVRTVMLATFAGMASP